jgi:hypothetical protein
MSRIRTIKPEWLDDERLALASPEARVLSVALMVLADDYGNGRASVAVLAGRVFPGKIPETLAKALDDLRNISFVILYELDGQQYYSIRNWAKHQRVDKPGAPRVPGPELVITVDSKHSGKVPGASKKVTGGAGKVRASRASYVPDPGPVSGPGPDPGQSGDVAKLRSHYAAEYHRVRGVLHKLPQGQGGRYGKAVQQCLDAYGLDESLTIVTRALDDPWQCANAPELWSIVAAGNKFRGNTPTNGRGNGQRTSHGLPIVMPGELAAEAMQDEREFNERKRKELENGTV